MPRRTLTAVALLVILQSGCAPRSPNLRFSDGAQARDDASIVNFTALVWQGDPYWAGAVTLTGISEIEVRDELGRAGQLKGIECFFMKGGWAVGGSIVAPDASSTALTAKFRIELSIARTVGRSEHEYRIVLRSHKDQNDRWAIDRKQDVDIQPIPRETKK